MNTMPRITATITVVETNEKHEVEFENVIQLLESVNLNIELAKVAYDRPIEVSDVQVEDECDDAYFAYSYADTNQLYLTVEAHRHTVQ